MSKIPEIPHDVPQHHRLFFKRMKELLETLPEASSAPVGPASNVRVTAGPGMLQIEFKGGDGADSHHVYVSNTPTWNPTIYGSHILDANASTKVVDQIGIAAVDRWYWIASFKGKIKGPTIGPFKGTTLALGAPLVPPGVAVVSQGNVTFDSTTNLPTVTDGNPLRGRKDFP